ncbi:hypothetical protein FB446DRAFT_792970 [Lentinula raphanica]|nr:hypothetical protein FB446DRAFT_792970 [Lentinula raphanica]
MTCFNIPIIPLGIIVAFLAPILSPKGVFAAPTAANRVGVDLSSPSTARGSPGLTLPVVRTGAGSYQVDDPSFSPATDAGIRGDPGEEGVNGVEQMERRDEIFNPLLKSRAATHKRYRALLLKKKKSFLDKRENPVNRPLTIPNQASEYSCIYLEHVGNAPGADSSSYSVNHWASTGFPDPSMSKQWTSSPPPPPPYQMLKMLLR